MAERRPALALATERPHPRSWTASSTYSGGRPMPRGWDDYVADRRRAVTFTVDASTEMLLLRHVDADYVSLVLGKDKQLVLRLSETGALRVARLLDAARA
jgi:hypothetical protein